VELADRVAHSTGSSEFAYPVAMEYLVDYGITRA
jgi:hypothetical protein